VKVHFSYRTKATDRSIVGAGLAPALDIPALGLSTARALGGAPWALTWRMLMTGTIRILISEDQMLMRQGLHTVLELEPGFQVVGEAANGEEAIERYNELQQQGKGPDVVLMDIQMPVKHGVQATAAIQYLFLSSSIKPPH